MSLWPFRRGSDAKRHDSSTSAAQELRIATSGSNSVRATIETLRVDGAGSYSQSGRVRAALFVPSTSTTIQFHAESHKKPGSNARASCVHALQMFSPQETSLILDDAKRIGSSIGWSDRGVSLPTQDVLVQNLSRESQDSVHKAIREHLLPFARRHYPHLNAAFDKQPYPRPGNLFIVRYSCASQRPGGRGLKLHKDETALTFNLCLSPEEDFTGGGTYFPAANSDVDGLLMRPLPGHCLIHDGNIKHAGNEVRTGERFILVGFYNADGRDRAGEDQYFGKKAREEARLKPAAAQPVQTIYFTTAVASLRPGVGVPASGSPSQAPCARPADAGFLGGDISQQRMGSAASMAIQQAPSGSSYKSALEVSSFSESCASELPTLPSCAVEPSLPPCAVPRLDLSPSPGGAKGLFGKEGVTPTSPAESRRHKQLQQQPPPPLMPSTLAANTAASSPTSSQLRPLSRPPSGSSRPPGDGRPLGGSSWPPTGGRPLSGSSRPLSGRGPGDGGGPPLSGGGRPLSGGGCRPPSGSRFPAAKEPYFPPPGVKGALSAGGGVSSSHASAVGRGGSGVAPSPRGNSSSARTTCLPSWMANIHSRLRPPHGLVK